MSDRQFTGSCPIREHTGDGHFVGRCEFATYDWVCPRHGLLDQYPDNDDRAVDPQARRFPPAPSHRRSFIARLLFGEADL